MHLALLLANNYPGNQIFNRGIVPLSSVCVGLFQSQLPVPLLVKPLLLDQTFLLTVLLAQTKDLTDLFVEFFFFNDFS